MIPKIYCFFFLIPLFYLADIMGQIKHMRADFGSLNHLSNEMCQMNTKIGRIAHRQSRLCGFAPSPSLEPTKESSSC